MGSTVRTLFSSGRWTAVVGISLALPISTSAALTFGGADVWAYTAPLAALVLVFNQLGTISRERFRTDQERRGPRPLAIAMAGTGGGIALAVFDSSSPALARLGITALTAGVAAAIGYGISRAVTSSDALPTTDRPAPPHVIRRLLAPDTTAVWAGRAPAPPRRVVFTLTSTYFLFGTATVGVGLAISDGRGFVLLGLLCSTNAAVIPLRFRSVRVRVALGPAGLVVRGGLTGRRLLTSPLGEIDSAWFTDAPKPNMLTGFGKSSRRERLAFLTRSGPALMIRFTDGTDLIISMDEPAEPAAVLNGLLDRRPAGAHGSGVFPC